MQKSKLTRFFQNESTYNERKEVFEWLLDPQNDIIIKQWMRENWDLICSVDLEILAENPDEKTLWLNIQRKIHENTPTAFLQISHSRENTLFSRIKKYAAVAAILILLLSSSIYLILQNGRSKNSGYQSNVASSDYSNDVAAPKGNMAVLTLANGKRIYIDSTVEGSLAFQGGVEVSKNAKGEIIYTTKNPDSISYNTLSIPKGSKPVRLFLADGSVVWLNAASSITFPTAFVGKERKVDITGETYFEVAKNPEMPFSVKSGDIVVKVLGTHFNINSYSDEKDVKVTLLEGKVNIASVDKNVDLKPGQQARFSDRNISVINNVDIDEVMSWKNDQFYFSGSDIKSIMRQIEKYYDVEVVYEDEVSYQFVAKISRTVNVSEFLKRLELTNLIHFKISGNKIIVRK